MVVRLYCMIMILLLRQSLYCSCIMGEEEVREASCFADWVTEIQESGCHTFNFSYLTDTFYSSKLNRMASL